MRLYLAFLLIIGATIADHNHAWETGNEYQYHIESRTLTVLNRLGKQFSGILMRGGLTLQVKSSDTLQAVVSKTQYASVNKILTGVWDEITDLEFNELSLSGKPFEITLKNGVIRDMLVDQDVPTWEVNLLKSFVSQLQIDTQSENVIASGRTEIPDENQTFGTFTVMEDSVGGKCEVRYSITPMNEENLLVPLPYLHKNDLHFGITKEKNYSRCEQRMAHHSRLVGKIIWKPGDNDELVSRSSRADIIISGHLRRFTIQSSIMMNRISVKSKTDDTYSGSVYSRVNITLIRKSQISNPIAVSNDLVSTGNLVYNYKNPLSNQRTPRPNADQSSSAAQSAERHSSNSSREENRSNDDSRFSSNSTTEERDYLQTKPKLDEAPENPLLPYFIGYRGQKSDENYALIAARLIDQISNEIENAHETFSRSFTDTLERFTILIRFIRTMNAEQIAEVENKLPDMTNDRSKFSSEEALKFYKQTVWDVFCYSVAHAGTGPALITIKNWIKNGKLEGVQAAQILSIIPKAALAPTPEYVAAFFELITDEQVTNQKFLNTTAPLSFAELTSYTRSHNTSPYLVHTFDSVASEHEDALLETYIPYMATQLTKAVESGDSRRIQTYIMALGYFGHPKILSIFEPYLNGTISVSKFQRLMMVVSLLKLSEKIPRVVRNVTYKIYRNVTEAYELRCAAVYIIMKTNPPLDMLQRMAEFTNQDQDQHVNSAVKSNIENFVKLERPEWKDIADKARIASKLLNPDINEGDSQGIFRESTYASLNLAQTTILQAIGGDDIGIPKLAYIGTHQSYGNFILSPSRILYIVSNIRDWITQWSQILMPDKVDENIIFDEIEELGIMPQDAEPLEGNIFMDSILALEFYPFDNHTIEEFANMLNDYIMSSWKTRKGIFESRNMNYLYHYDITLGFPTESGLPFVYTLTIPKFTMIGGRGSYEIVTSETDEFTEVTAVGYVALSEKIQSRIGFVTPFEYKHYIASVDINTQIVIPAGLSLKWGKWSKRRFELKVFPNKNDTRYGEVVTHLSVVPYTAIHDILEPRPGYLGNKGSLVYREEPQILKYSQANLWMTAKSDQIDWKPSRTEMETFSEICKVLYKGVGAHYRTFDSIFYFTAAQVNVTFDSYIALKNENSEATIPTVIDKRPDSEARTLQFLQEVGKDMNSPIGHIFDMSILMGHNNSNYVFTLAMADSYVDDKSQVLLYWNTQSPDDEDAFSEFCALGYTRSSRIPLNFDEAIEKIPNNEFKAELRFGSCADGDTIILKGNWTRTNDVMQVLETKAEIVDECRQEMRQGNIWLRSCERASELIQQKDLLTMSMETNSDLFYAIGNNMLYYIEMMVPNTNTSILNSRSINNNTIDMEIKLSQDNNDATISLRTVHTDVSFSLTDIFEDISDVEFKKYLEQFFFSGASEELSCVVDKTQVVTFDDKSYPLKLGKCRHMIMATLPKRDPSNPQKILNNPRNLMVMAREMDDGSIAVLIVFGRIRIGSLVHNIYLRKLNDSGHLEAMVDGGVVNLPHYESYSYYGDRETLNIYQLDGMIVVHLIRHEIYAVYDGERIKLHASDKYGNSVRGLCGNYDMQSNNDFVTPSNCVLTKPEEFAAMYALTQDTCEGPALQNKRRAEQSACIPISNIPADLFSERKTGRYPFRNRG